ncbi:CCAAT/enhancer-binding protein gamma isoform X2 [Hetaerina americana]|uniref:CCAAT/enhancer-binding protein gamma isoform X2 n=1 Tax=Hetaerina americana TaxID=62018 RepID=UPI003A7F3C86
MNTGMSPRNGDNEGDRGGRRSQGKRPSSSRGPGASGEDYRRRRDRNNLAVKRSRVRSKLRTQETLERVRTLKAENEALEGRIEALGKELGFLKELFITHAGTPINTNEVDLEALLRDNDYDDDLLNPVRSREQTGRHSADERDFKAESPGDGDAEDSEPHGPS